MKFNLPKLKIQNFCRSENNLYIWLLLNAMFKEKLCSHVAVATVLKVSSYTFNA